MKVTTQSKDVTVPSTLLKNLNGGNVFYFASMSYEQALKEDAIYQVVSGGKDSRVQISNLKDGLLLMRDDCHKVVELNASMIVEV